MGRVDDVIELCCELFPYEEIRTTLNGAVAGGGIAGTAATVGAIFFGPPGLLVGGTLGGLLGFGMYQDTFKPLPQVLMELSPQQKKELFYHLLEVLKNKQWTDYVHLLSLVSDQPNVKKQLLKAIRQFFKE
nr:PREDICTED: protein C19orf12 homolog [Paralichthys olivaceus]